jgi:hypothetical protein
MVQRMEEGAIGGKEVGGLHVGFRISQTPGSAQGGILTSVTWRGFPAGLRE